MPDTISATAPLTLAYPVNGRCPQVHVHSGNETISNFVRTHRIWQRPLTKFLVAHLAVGDVFVDVGANIGCFTVYAGLLVGDRGKVHAIEPAEDNLSLLAANVELNGLTNVTIHRLAASSRSGNATFYCSSFNGGGHSLLPHTGLRPGPTVPLATLDDLLAEERPPKIIKIDVQGAELDVLQGATQLLGRGNARPWLLLEFSPLFLHKLGRLQEFFAFVAAGNYSLRGFITNERANVDPPQLRRSTLHAICEDLISVEDPSEFDLLMVPR